MESIKLTLEIPADLATALTAFLESVKVVAIEKTGKRNNEEDSCVDVDVEVVDIPVDEDEVVAYCRDNGLSVDGRKFYAYYSKLKWHNTKGVPIDNWKQLIRKWDEEDNKKREAKDPLQDSYKMMRGWADK